MSIKKLTPQQYHDKVKAIVEKKGYQLGQHCTQAINFAMYDGETPQEAANTLIAAFNLPSRKLQG
jgi:hypothetical protein